MCDGRWFPSTTIALYWSKGKGTIKIGLGVNNLKSIISPILANAVNDSANAAKLEVELHKNIIYEIDTMRISEAKKRALYEVVIEYLHYGQFAHFTLQDLEKNKKSLFLSMKCPYCKQEILSFKHGEKAVFERSKIAQFKKTFMNNNLQELINVAARAVRMASEAREVIEQKIENMNIPHEQSSDIYEHINEYIHFGQFDGRSLGDIITNGNNCSHLLKCPYCIQLIDMPCKEN